MSIAVTTTDPTNTGVSTTSSSSLTGSNAADLQSSFLTLGNDSNLLIVFYVQIMPDDFVMQLHRF